MTRRLTPLEAELRHQDLRPGEATLRERMQRRRQRNAPTTTAGAIARGLLRLAIFTAVACGIAVVVDLLVNRRAAFGFYVVGAAILGAGFLIGAGGGRTRYSPSRGAREQSVRTSMAFVLVGAIVFAIAILVDVLSS